eukprot:6491370-Amphidinium_carterae.1
MSTELKLRGCLHTSQHVQPNANDAQMLNLLLCVYNSLSHRRVVNVHQVVSVNLVGRSENLREAQVVGRAAKEERAVRDSPHGAPESRHIMRHPNIVAFHDALDTVRQLAAPWNMVAMDMLFRCWSAGFVHLRMVLRPNTSTS